VEMADDTTNATATPKLRRAHSEYIIQVPDEKMEVESETRTYPPVFRDDFYNVSATQWSLSLSLFIDADPKVDCVNNKGIPQIPRRRRYGCNHRDLKTPTYPTSPLASDDGGGRP
jgi:hypothetical protein